MATQKIGLLTLTCLSIAATAPSFAAQTTTSWTGLYLGAQAGYGWGKDRIKDELIGSPGFSDWNDHFDMDGTTGGVYAGYNYQRGTWVYGLEFNVESANIKGDDAKWPFGDKITAKINGQGAARARVGYAFGPALLYATGGLAFANVKTDYYDAGATDSYSQTRAGWTLGVGAEYAFAPNWTGRLDYQYADFGRLTDPATTTDPGWQYHHDITTNAVRLGVGYKF